MFSTYFLKHLCKFSRFSHKVPPIFHFLYFAGPTHIRDFEGVSKSFRTGRLGGGRELQMVQLSAIRCSCVAILWVSLVSFAAIIFCVTSQWAVPKVSVYFVIDSVRKLLDTLSCKRVQRCEARTTVTLWRVCGSDILKCRIFHFRDEWLIILKSKLNISV
jgi:hypothetical protein